MDVSFKVAIKKFKAKDLLFVDINPIYEEILQFRKRSKPWKEK